MLEQQKKIIAPLRNVGFGLHWLHKKSKRPVGEGWSEAPVASLDDLLNTYQDGYNLGVRLGMSSSLTDGSYLHVLDIDIRVPELADEAWETVETLFADLNIRSFPTVISGSGGESRHIYFVTSKPFYSRKLAVSEGKHRSPDGKWRYDFEIELFGTGKQVAMPPSIHPDTGKPYIWGREFDFDMLEMGVGPTIAAERLSEIATAQCETFEFETREPLTFKVGQLEAELDELDDSHIEDYHDWVAIGAALHHQFGGSNEGYKLWIKVSKQSAKFNEKEMPSKWRSFGRNRRAPVTMATVRQWVLDERHQRIMSQFDDVDGFDEPLASEPDDIDDLLGEPSKPAARDPIDDLIGEPATPPKPRDDLDDIIDGAVASKSDEAHWTTLLDFNEEGALRPNLSNISLLMMHDPRLGGVAQLNEFTHETVQRASPKTKSAHRKNAAKPTLQLEGRIWDVKDKVNGELWSDDRDFAIRRIIEAPKTQGGYGVKVSDRDLKAAIVIAANARPFHPIREYLNGLSWDGKARADELFIRYLGAEDSRYHRDIARLMLIAAVTRIFEPGAKFDFAVIIEGLQGKRKSTFIETLGKSWFAELDGDFHDQKAMIELMQGAWIMEIPELSGFNRGDVRSIKAFISRKKDRARLAYARRAGEFPRQCIFIGSTNDREYLKDDTGGRRFFPCMCNADEIDIAGLEVNVDQIWAEAMVLYQQMRAAQPYGTLPLYLQEEDSKITAARLQESRRVESADDAIKGQIAAWLDAPINNIGFDDVDDHGQPKYRDETCLIELWCECLNGDRKQYGQVQAQMLGRVMNHIDGWVKGGTETDGAGSYYISDRYGRQRAYRRGGTISILRKQGLPI